ncbi:hypothetical protein TWF281_004713 [Arthrobotrys megalospora]
MKLRDFLTSATAPPLEIPEEKSPTNTTPLPSNLRNLQINLEEWNDLKLSIKKLFKPYLDKDYPHLPTLRYGSTRVYTKTSVVNVAVGVFEWPALFILEDTFGIRGGFDTDISHVNIGNPDRVFYLLDPPDGSLISKARFAIEFKTPWELPLPANLKDIFNENNADPDNKYTKAIQQLYTCLAVNNLEFGVLSNYDSTFIFRRVEEDEDDDKKIMRISPMFRYSDTGLESPLAAFTYLCHYTATKNWIYRTPTLEIIPPPRKQYPLNFGTMMDTVGHEGAASDWKGMALRLETGLPKNIASVMTGYITKKAGNTILKPVIFKLYDLTEGEAVEHANRELVAYHKCHQPQGVYIPKIYAVGTM